MKILEFIIIFAFVAFLVFLVIGFNKQIQEKAKIREEKYKKMNENRGLDNE